MRAAAALVVQKPLAAGATPSRGCLAMREAPCFEKGPARRPLGHRGRQEGKKRFALTRLEARGRLWRRFGRLRVSGMA